MFSPKSSQQGAQQKKKKKKTNAPDPYLMPHHQEVQTILAN